ncbi:hypothetical protein M569_03641, partial [Genlisea aurea]
SNDYEASMEWKRGPAIGRGSSATVYLATAIAAGELFAVKSSDLRSSSALRREERLISELRPPLVVKCLGSDVTDEGGRREFNLFLEYVSGGTLSDLIRNSGGSLDEKTIQFYAHQLAIGLRHIHGKGIVHCDVKGKNILIGEEGTKICDFGCARFAEPGGGSVISGTPAYMAPEVARGEEQEFPADIWALGCTVIEMATGSNPWPEMKDPASTLYRVAYSGDTPEFPDWLSTAAKDFIGKCLIKEPNERWTAAELVRHPFLASGMERPTRESPTTVVDQTFWDSIEDSESMSEFIPSTESPADRITSLIGGESNSLYSPNWDGDEDWSEVRGISTEENYHVDIISS